MKKLGGRIRLRSSVVRYRVYHYKLIGNVISESGGHFAIKSSSAMEEKQLKKAVIIVNAKCDHCFDIHPAISVDILDFFAMLYDVVSFSTMSLDPEELALTLSKLLPATRKQMF